MADTFPDIFFLCYEKPSYIVESEKSLTTEQSGLLGKKYCPLTALIKSFSPETYFQVHLT